MNPIFNFLARGSARALIACSLLIALSACGSNADADSAEASAPAPQADAALVAEAVEGASAATAKINALCDTATFAEVTAAAGGNFDKVDVIDESGLHYLDCVYLDSRDLYAGLTVRYVSSERLVATSSNWPTAAAYFEEWGRGGDPVSGLGERAVWANMPSGLLVLKGDHALHFSASKSDLADPSVRAKFQTLAQSVIARLP